MAYLNKCMLIGNLGKDPEIHARNIELLDKGREDNIERERKRPWLAKKGLHDHGPPDASATRKASG